MIKSSTVFKSLTSCLSGECYIWRKKELMKYQEAVSYKPAENEPSLLTSPGKSIGVKTVLYSGELSYLSVAYANSV